MYICNCRAISTDAVREAVRQGATDPIEVSRRTGVGTWCGACLPRTVRVIHDLSQDDER